MCAHALGRLTLTHCTARRHDAAPAELRTQLHAASGGQGGGCHRRHPPLLRAFYGGPAHRDPGVWSRKGGSVFIKHVTRATGALSRAHSIRAWPAKDPIGCLPHPVAGLAQIPSPPFSPPSPQPLKVWTDYPALPSVSKVLVNDLDLTVRASGLGGIPLLGNGGSIANETQPDRENNVEQVSMSFLPVGPVAIQVDAHFVHASAGRQPYALAVNGAFAGTLAVPGDGEQGPACTIVVPSESEMAEERREADSLRACRPDKEEHSWLAKQRGMRVACPPPIVIPNHVPQPPFLAGITKGPSGPTNATPIVFEFAAAGNAAYGGLAWECLLADSNGAVGSTGTQDWKVRARGAGMGPSEGRWLEYSVRHERLRNGCYSLASSC